MRAAQLSAGIWGDTGGAVAWGPVSAVLTLGGPGSEINMVKTESGHQVFPPLFTGTTAAALLGSQGQVADLVPTLIGTGRQLAGGGSRYCHGCRTNLTAGLGPDSVSGGGELGR